MKKGDTFEPKNITVAHVDYMALKSNMSKLVASKHVLENTVKIAKQMDIVKTFETIVMPFEEFY